MSEQEPTTEELAFLAFQDGWCFGAKAEHSANGRTPKAVCMADWLTSESRKALGRKPAPATEPASGEFVRAADALRNAVTHADWCQLKSASECSCGARQVGNAYDAARAHVAASPVKPGLCSECDHDLGEHSESLLGDGSFCTRERCDCPVPNSIATRRASASPVTVPSVSLEEAYRDGWDDAACHHSDEYTYSDSMCDHDWKQSETFAAVRARLLDAGKVESDPLRSSMKRLIAAHDNMRGSSHVVQHAEAQVDFMHVVEEELAVARKRMGAEHA